MSENLLNAEIREATGKEFAKKLRQAGKVPGIFYTREEKSVPIVLDEREIMKILTSETGLIDVKIGNKGQRKAIIKEVQTDPVKQYLVHVDIMGVRLEEKIAVSVPVRIVGDAIGVREQGGILHQYLRELEISCLPLEIPEYIDVDVAELGMGDSVSLNALTVEKVTFIGDLDQPIVSVLIPTIIEEPEVTEEVEDVEGEEGEEGEEVKDEDKEAETTEDKK